MTLTPEQTAEAIALLKRARRFTPNRRDRNGRLCLGDQIEAFLEQLEFERHEFHQ